jgi:hypothetical protein
MIIKMQRNQEIEGSAVAKNKGIGSKVDFGMEALEDWALINICSTAKKEV